MRESLVIGVLVTHQVTLAASERACPTVSCTIDTLGHCIEDVES